MENPEASAPRRLGLCSLRLANAGLGLLKPGFTGSRMYQEMSGLGFGRVRDVEFEPLGYIPKILV